MTGKGKNTRFTFTRTISTTAMTSTEWEAAEDLLASMVARAIAADNPEWFGMGRDEKS